MLLPATPVADTGAASCPSCSLPTQLPANAPGKAHDDGPSVRTPATHMDKPDEAPGSGLA